MTFHYTDLQTDRRGRDRETGREDRQRHRDRQTDQRQTDKENIHIDIPLHRLTDR